MGMVSLPSTGAVAETLRMTSDSNRAKAGLLLLALLPPAQNASITGEYHHALLHAVCCSSPELRNRERTDMRTVKLGSGRSF